MSDTLLAFVVTALLIGFFFAWVPFLEWICLPCGRFVERLKKREPEVRGPRAVASPRRSRV